MSVKINDGESNKLQITIPAKGETGWSSKVRQAFQDIGDHDHSGGGKGTQLTATSIADDAITPAKLSADVKLSSLADVQDTDQSAANLAGKILTYSNGAFRPLEFNSQNFTDIDTVININTQTELDAATFPRGSVVSVRNTSGTGYASGAADFSSNTLDGITIVADYPVKTSIITNCTIICSDAVELAGLTTNCKVQSNNNLTLSSGNIVNSDLHADALVSSNSATIAIEKSKGFFNAVNITNSNLSVVATSILEFSTITSLSGTPSAPAGTGSYKIIRAVVRKQKLPETASNGSFLTWDGSEWGGSSKLVIDTTSQNVITLDNNANSPAKMDFENPSDYPVMGWNSGSSKWEASNRANIGYRLGISTISADTLTFSNINHQTSGSGTPPAPNRFLFNVPDHSVYIVRKIEVIVSGGDSMGSNGLVFNCGNFGTPITGNGTITRSVIDSGTSIPANVAMGLMFSGGLTQHARQYTTNGGQTVTINTYEPTGVLYPGQKIFHNAPNMQGGGSETYTIKFYVYDIKASNGLGEGTWTSGQNDDDPFDQGTW